MRAMSSSVLVSVGADCVEFAAGVSGVCGDQGVVNDWQVRVGICMVEGGTICKSFSRFSLPLTSEYRDVMVMSSSLHNSRTSRKVSSFHFIGIFRKG